jgi:cell division protein FtsB
VNTAVRPLIVPEEGKEAVPRRRLRIRVRRLAFVLVVAYLGALFLYGEVQDIQLGQRAAALNRALMLMERRNVALEAQLAVLRERNAAASLAAAKLHLARPGMTPVLVVHGRS